MNLWRKTSIKYCTFCQFVAIFVDKISFVVREYFELSKLDFRWNALEHV